MKLFGSNETYKVTNKSGGRIAMGKFALKHGDSKEICPMNYSDDVVKALDIFLARGSIVVDHIKAPKQEKKEDLNVVKKETVKNSKGDKHEHSVFDPESAKKERAIKVESLEDNSKAVEVAFGETDKVEAIDFLEQHWKKIEKELIKYRSVRKLEFMLSVADEIGMNGNKKYELIEDRIKELKD